MKKQILVAGLSVISIVSFAQKNKKDKGEFVEYENKFYTEIKKGLNEYENGSSSTRRVFKMDFEGKAIPKSVDEFTTVWCVDPISQGRTGTCWSFATSSFYEAEIYRISQKQVDLSEIHTVYWEYVLKATEYIRTRGESFFGEGSETNAVTRVMKNYGVVPAEKYTGIKNGQPFHDHAKMYDEMKEYLESLKATNAWNEEVAIETIKSILNHYLGTPPKVAVNENSKNPLTPPQYLRTLGLEMDNYVNFMSLKEAPYNQKAEYDVPDNWWNSTDYYNVELNDFMTILKDAIKNGYSIAIGGDVSETGYSPNDDVAMIPSYDIPSEYIDENARQLRFSNGSTTDDHAIHVVGYKETKDDFWFLIKDSGSGARNGKNKGFYFYHEDFVKLKTMTFTIHKDAVNDDIKKKINLK